MTAGKTIALTRRTFVGKVTSLLFNMLSWCVIAFLSRSKCLLISLTTVILKPKNLSVYFYLAMLHGLRDVRSLTKGLNWGHGSEGAKSYHQTAKESPVCITVRTNLSSYAHTVDFRQELNGINRSVWGKLHICDTETFSPWTKYVSSFIWVVFGSFQ